MGRAYSILAVDDNEEALFALQQLLVADGYRVLTAQSGSETLRTLESELPDAILLDINMPAPDGYAVTRHIKADPVLKYTPVVLLTAKDELEEVIFGFEQGADDYIKKPFKSAELLARLKAVIRMRELYLRLQKAAHDNVELSNQLHGRYTIGGIIGHSSVMQEVFALIEKVKDADVPVLITGASGTGKELVASAIHYNSPRRQKPMVVLNCSAFNENLLESELFGHVKGSFTGAVRDKEGLFEAADGSTFFLDELGEMSPALQVKLLRVLQDGTFMPVGGTALKKVSVRIVTATNRDLRAMIADGRFREDLFYRLNVINIKLPLLRERRSDIPYLLEHFLVEISKRTNRERKNISQAALLALCDYDWPGNIRELQNEVERVVLLAGSESEIGLDLISSHIRGAAADSVASRGAAGSGKLKDAVETLERHLIGETLKRVQGNKSEAARELGISRSNLIAKVQGYGLE